MTIKELREKEKLSQAKLASALGVSPSLIGAIETGKKNVSEKLADKVKDVYGVTLVESEPAEIAANAAVGTVVYATKVEKAPNLEAIDDSWGDPSIVVNSKSPNTELYNYWTTENKYVKNVWDMYISGGYNFAPEDYDVELYYHWDNKYLYFGLKTEDHAITGWQQPWDLRLYAKVLKPRSM